MNSICRKWLAGRWNVAVVLSLLVLGAVFRPACGDVVTWTVTSGTWNIGSNWSSGAAPTTSGTAIVDSGRTVLLGAGVSGTAASVIIANATTGTMSLSGGQLTAATSIVGNNQGANGTVNISSGTWANSGDDVVLHFVVVPEPSTTTLAIAGLVRGGWSMWRVRGRRRRMVA